MGLVVGDAQNVLKKKKKKKIDIRSNISIKQILVHNLLASSTVAISGQNF